MLQACVLLLALASTPQDGLRAPEIQAALNQVVPLDGNHEVVVDLRFEDTGQEGAGGRFYCSRPCRGNVHLLHSTCDFSCDGPCAAGGTHTLEVEAHRAGGLPDGPELKAWSDSLRTFGSQMEPVEAACTIMNNACQDFYRAVDATKITMNRQCWVDQPCSYDAKDVVLRYFRLVATWRLRRTTIVNGRPVHTLGPKGTLTLFEAGIPQRRTKEGFGMAINCACQGTAIVPGEGGTGFIGGEPGSATGTTPGTGTRVRVPGGEFNDEPRVREQTPPVQVTPEDPKAVLENPNGQIGFLPQCQNMNVATLAGTNPFKTDLNIRMRPGTVFDTDEDGIQDMILVMTYIWVLRGVDAEAERPRGPSTLEELVQGRLNIMCLEMNKRPPNPSVKYRLLPTHDPMLVRIASLANPITIGEQDQARIWVYTDGASYGQIAEKLIPAPDRGQYVKAVHDVKCAGASLAGPKYADCFKPENLNTSTDRRTAAKWYVEELIRRSPETFYDWAENKADFSEAFAADKKGESYAHVARIVRVLYLTGKPEAQHAALLMLKNRVPATAREKMAKENLIPAFSLSRSKNAELAALAKEVRTLYGS